MHPGPSHPGLPHARTPRPGRRPRPSGHPAGNPRRRGLALAAVLVLAALAGCGQDGVLTPGPDCDGVRLLVFASDRRQTAGRFDVYLYDLDAGGYRAVRLNSSSPDVHPAITREGRAIALQTTRSGTGSDILVYDRCSGQFVNRPEIASPADESEPAFSGDSNRLAFVRDTLGRRRLRLLDGVARRFQPLPLLEQRAAAVPHDDYSPSLSQDARWIAFVSNEGGNGDVLVYDRAGDSLRALPDLASAGDDVEPWITPDGRYVAFASNRVGGLGGYDIYLYDIGTRTFVDVTNLNGPADDRHPAMSPDADHIAFESSRTGGDARGKTDLWIYRRSLQSVHQPPELSSTADDVHPSLAWP